MNTLEVMKISPVIPVVVLEDANNALPLAEALMEGGINIMEITLRTNTGLKAIEIISKNIPKMHVGAGTVFNKKDLYNSLDAGAKFIFSPGISEELITASKKVKITFIPGVATASEVMIAKNGGLNVCKLFPANTIGGIKLLKSFGEVFSEMYFCPTGGINQSNFKDFLNLKNVLCVGGSWIVPNNEIKNRNFKAITKLCKEIFKLLN